MRKEIILAKAIRNVGKLNNKSFHKKPKVEVRNNEIKQFTKVDATEELLLKTISRHTKLARSLAKCDAQELQVDSTEQACFSDSRPITHPIHNRASN